MKSPKKNMINQPRSPMNDTLQTIKLIETKLRDEPHSPDNILLGFMKKCKTDMTNSIVQRVETLTSMDA
jgi:hypothetical protein